MIDTADDQIKKTISGIKNPYSVTATPDGSRIVITGDANTVAIVDTRTSAIIGTLSLPAPAYSAAFSPDGKLAYLAGCSGPGFNCDASVISVVDMSTFAVVRTIPVPGEYWPGIAIAHDGKHLYVSSDGGTVTVDVSTGAVTKVSPVGAGPMSIATGPEGWYVYVVGWNEQQHESELIVIDTESNSVAEEIPIDVDPMGIALSPDASRIYLSHCNNETADECQGGFIAVFNTATRKIIKSIALGANTYPYGVALNKDGAQIYVANDNSPGTVIAIDAQSKKIKTVVNVGRTPFGMAVASVPTTVVTSDSHH